MSFSVEFHHMGSFVNDPTLHYEGGQIHVVHNLDIDKWSYFEALGIVKHEFGYSGEIKMWWKARELGFENGLNLITLDSHALELAKYALTNKCEVEVYIEHGVSLPGDVEEVPLLMCNDCNVGGGESKGKHVCDVVEDEVVEMGDGSVEDIHFDDSKEESVVAPDDGFGFGNPSQPSIEHGDKCEKVRGKRKSVPAKRPIGLRRILPMRKAKKVWTGGVDGNGEMSGNDGEIRELEEEHNTEELDSGKSVSDSKGDGASKPNYTTFKKEYMSKDFEFELGMEFGSLQEFKEAIIEHSILNGREIRFQKNDAVRVRVKCKRTCNFVALVSKDASSFRMKTLVSKHTCERVFNNKNANSKWVAKVVANKFQSNDKMKIKDIIGEIRSSFATGITTSRARKARQIAKGMWTASSQQPHPQGGQPTTDPVEATLRQKKATAKEQPATSQKRRKGKLAATCARKTQKSHVSTMSQHEGTIDAGPNVHTAFAEIVEPLRYIAPTG